MAANTYPLIDHWTNHRVSIDAWETCDSAQDTRFFTVVEHDERPGERRRELRRHRIECDNYLAFRDAQGNDLATQARAVAADWIEEHRAAARALRATMPAIPPPPY